MSIHTFPLRLLVTVSCADDESYCAGGHHDSPKSRITQNPIPRVAIRNVICANPKLKQFADRELTWADPEQTLEERTSYTIPQVAMTLRIGKAVGQKYPESLGQDAASLLTSSGLVDPDSISVLSHIGLIFRNGKVHPYPGSKRMFTAPAEVLVLRKLLLGLDEEHVDRRLGSCGGRTVKLRLAPAAAKSRLPLHNCKSLQVSCQLMKSALALMWYARYGHFPLAKPIRIVSATKQGPSPTANYDSVETDYDVAGRFSTITDGGGVRLQSATRTRQRSELHSRPPGSTSE
ncbi:MAG: hypothetical protein JWN45_3183 [Acidobacteriaceae bacterium]|nr:hypothetical protein [Acidobacteriaceae bacterium]